MSQQAYRSSSIPTCFQVPVMDAPSADIFGDFERFEASHPPAPCRSIPVTADMVARDRAAQLARAQTAPDWKIKAELSEDNLRIVRTTPAPGRRVVATKQKPAKAPKPPQKLCADCSVALDYRAKGDRCAQHRPRPGRVPKSPPRFCTCGNPIRANSKSGLCLRCNRLVEWLITPTCKPRVARETRISRRQRVVWTEERDQVLRDRYERHLAAPTRTVRIFPELSEALGVSKGTCIVRARQLGLSRQKERHWTKGELALIAQHPDKTSEQIMGILAEAHTPRSLHAVKQARWKLAHGCGSGLRGGDGRAG